MKIEKKILDHIERCYCTASLTIDGEPWLVLASEAEGGPCYAYSGTDYSRREVIWEHGGGTMAFVQIPGSNEEFIAVQNFFPGFRSATAKLVRGKRLADGKWHTEDLVSIPYVHRFDLFQIGERICILACILCGSKKEREDWSDPGFVSIGWLPEQKSGKIVFTPILTGLTKNHGYYRGENCGYIACDEGIFALTPPDTSEGNWSTACILQRPVSDLTLCDLDGDGKDELITIEPFHGDSIYVYHKDGSAYRQVYSYPTPIQFAHAVVGCSLAGKPCVVCGIRRKDAELSLIRCKDPAAQQYEVECIDSGVGPSNVAVLHQDGQDLILSANHTKNEGAVYIVTE